MKGHALLLIALGLLGFGLVSKRAQRSVVTAPTRSTRYTASQVDNVGAVTYSSPVGAIERWKAATLGGSVANVDTCPEDATWNTVPDRSPTYRVPS